MSNFPIFRARSAITLPRARSVERGDVATLTRNFSAKKKKKTLSRADRCADAFVKACYSTISKVATVPNLGDIHVGEGYRPSTLYKYRHDYDLLDDYFHDRTYFYTPLYWQDYRFAARRYLNTDPVPRSLGFEYPAFWSRYKWYTDWLNPTYWRRHRDPNYDRPLWNNWQPWHLDRNNVKRAIRMYREGLVDFATLDKYWIEPTALSRKGKDWADVYLPAGRYGARRYFYSFA